MEFQFSARPQPVTRGSRRAQPGGKATELTLRCHVVLPQGDVVSQRLLEKGLSHGKRVVGKERAWLAPLEVTSPFITSLLS